jgi:hypothetical protein
MRHTLLADRSLTRAALWLGLAAPLVVCGCEDNKTIPENTNPYQAGTAAPLSCVPNLDGVIESSELQAALGVAAKYTVSPARDTRPVDLVGAVDSNGQRVWDWGASYADDKVATIQASTLQGKWYASSFPNGQFVTPFDAGDTLEAVYSQDDKGLYLQGLASTLETPPEGKTLWVYDTPVTLYQLPLKAGAMWTSTGVTRNGMARGLNYAATDVYQGVDLETGQLVLPDFTFTQAHRLRFVVTTTLSAGGSPVVNRQDSFLFECFGEIGRATAQPKETNDDFTTAAEIRRLGT